LKFLKAQPPSLVG